MSEDLAAAAIGEGRARPAFEPKSLQCPNCGSPLTVQDERAMLVVCPSCASDVQLTRGEAVVLGQRDGAAPDFKLELGQSFHWEGHRYEIAARMAYSAADDDWNDPPTHMYLLYSPRRRSMWLSQYENKWDLSWTSHIAPTKLPFNESRVQSFDGRTWRVDETDLATLIWVDGAVPWVARIGDQWVYSECSNTEGQTYEVQRSAEQLEFAEGIKLKASQVYEALGMADAAAQAEKREHRSRPVGWFPRLVLAMAAFFALGINFMCCCGSMGAGTDVYEDTFTPADFTVNEGEILSKPFALSGGLAEVSIDAPRLANAWMSVDLALVKEDQDTVIHIDDMDVDYYSGYEGGESWSEGSTTDSRTWSVPEAGTYHLLVRARGNSGETEVPDGIPPASVRVAVRDGVQAWWWPGMGFFCSFLGACLAFAMIVLAPWRRS